MALRVRTATSRAVRNLTAVVPAVLVMLVMLAAPVAPPAGASSGQPPVRIELTGMAPRLVTTDSAGRLSVSGRVVNDSDRSIAGLEVRVQRGEPVGDEAELRDALAGVVEADTVTPSFADLPGVLPPGGAMNFRIEVPLRGDPDVSLHLDEAGVYPLLVNLNGTPEFSDRARLAAVRLLLPVLGLPAARGRDGADEVVPAAPATPTPLTVVWPLVDQPRRLPTGNGASLLLTDDDLAASLAPGGRLFGLLAAAQQYAPAGSALAPAMCFAIDPDLIATVRAMADGPYRVAAGGGDGQRPADGTGSQAAAAWLAQLNALVGERCVLALPFADVDLVALSRAGLTDLQGRARTDGAQILFDELDVTPVAELTWPAGELLDERTLTDLASLGDRAVLVDPAGLVEPGPATGQAVVDLATGSAATAGVRGLLTDPLISQTLASQPAPTKAPDVAPGSAPPSTSPTGTRRPLAVQDAIAALTFRAGAGGNGVLLTPPRRWSTRTDEAEELLRTAAALLGAGLAEPRDLGQLAASATAGEPAVTSAVSYPVRAGTEEIQGPVMDAVTELRDQLRDIADATERDPRAQFDVDPAQLLDPLNYGLLRGISTAWRGRQGVATQLVAAADDGLTGLRRRIRIEPPAGPYLLGASNAPLLLTLDNRLPVQIDVQITLSEVPGLRTDEIDVVQVPAASRRQIRIATEVIRAGQFSVNAYLATPGGTPLGVDGPGHIHLRSTAYGTVTLALTGGAAVLLVLLTGYRITRRVRAGKASSQTTGNTTGKATAS